MTLTSGLRQRVREDLDVVYYYRSDPDQNESMDAGWYLEDASNKRIGPFDTSGAATDYAKTVPACVVFPSE